MWFSAALLSLVEARAVLRCDLLARIWVGWVCVSMVAAFLAGCYSARSEWELVVAVILVVAVVFDRF